MIGHCKIDDLRRSNDFFFVSTVKPFDISSEIVAIITKSERDLTAVCNICDVFDLF